MNTKFMKCRSVPNFPKLLCKLLFEEVGCSREVIILGVLHLGG